MIEYNDPNSKRGFIQSLPEWFVPILTSFSFFGFCLGGMIGSGLVLKLEFDIKRANGNFSQSLLLLLEIIWFSWYVEVCNREAFTIYWQAWEFSSLAFRRRFLSLGLDMFVELTSEWYVVGEHDELPSSTSDQISSNHVEGIDLMFWNCKLAPASLQAHHICASDDCNHHLWCNIYTIRLLNLLSRAVSEVFSERELFSAYCIHQQCQPQQYLL